MFTEKDKKESSLFYLFCYNYSRASEDHIGKKKRERVLTLLPHNKILG